MIFVNPARPVIGLQSFNRKRASPLSLKLQSTRGSRLRNCSRICPQAEQDICSRGDPNNGLIFPRGNTRGLFTRGSKVSDWKQPCTVPALPWSVFAPPLTTKNKNSNSILNLHYWPIFSSLEILVHLERGLDSLPSQWCRDDGQLKLW